MKTFRPKKSKGPNRQKMVEVLRARAGYTADYLGTLSTHRVEQLFNRLRGSLTRETHSRLEQDRHHARLMR